MSKKQQDPGWGERSFGSHSRIINRDGRFNVRRIGRTSLPHVYQVFLNMPAWLFCVVIIVLFSIANLFFAALYYINGVNNLQGITATDPFNQFLQCLFFSAQTLTTVGYGTIAPVDVFANVVAAFEAMSGWLIFAVITGFVFTRISRPRSYLLFTRNAVITQADPPALMFKIANERPNVLMDVEAKVLLRLDEQDSDGTFKHRYYQIDLEISKIHFLPLTWTIVHRVTPDSPLFGKSAEELKAASSELLVLIKAFDDTLNQSIHARHSYSFDEVLWNRKFLRCFYPDESGKMILDFNKFNSIEPEQEH